MKEMVFRIKEAFVIPTCIFHAQDDVRHGLQLTIIF